MYISVVQHFFPGQHSEGGGFPSSIDAQYAHTLPFLQVESYIVQNLSARIRFFQSSGSESPILKVGVTLYKRLILNVIPTLVVPQFSNFIEKLPDPVIVYQDVQDKIKERSQKHQENFGR